MGPRCREAAKTVRGFDYKNVSVGEPLPRRRPRSAEAVVGDLLRDGRVRHAEQARDLRAVAARELQQPRDVRALERRPDRADVRRRPGRRAKKCPPPGSARVGPDSTMQPGSITSSARQDDGPLDHVAQLAHVAGVVVGAPAAARSRARTAPPACASAPRTAPGSARASGRMSSRRSRSGGTRMWNTSRR